MDAITKKWLSDEKIIKMYQNAIKKQVVPDKIVKLSGGFCSAVYLLTGGEEKVVLKVGTDTDVKVMRHEKMYLPVEAEMMKILNENTNILMPRLVVFLLFSWLLEDAKEKQIDIPGITAKELLGLIEKSVFLGSG